MANLVGHRVGDAADRKAAERVPDEDNVGQFFGLDDVEDVLGESIQRYVFRQQMLALAESGLRWREHLASGGTQPVRNPAPAPAAMPGAMNQHERLRRGLRLCCSSARACRQTCNSHCFQDIPTLHDRCSLERNDDSKKSHPALAVFFEAMAVASHRPAHLIRAFLSQRNFISILPDTASI